jgi:hypothetical protein
VLRAEDGAGLPEGRRDGALPRTHGRWIDLCVSSLVSKEYRTDGCFCICLCMRCNCVVE